jgi:hypothetical protein
LTLETIAALSDDPTSDCPQKLSDQAGPERKST